MKAAIYCRISQDKTGEGAGVTRQLEDCTAVAQAAGWEVHEVYTDNDVSATSGKPRPEYRRMLRAIEAGEVEAIVAWAPDRLYRKLADLEALIPLVEKHSTAIRTCRAGDFDLGTPLGKMIARILGAVATGEGDVKVDRWRRSVRQRREQGWMPGSGPRMFGWTRTGEVIESEAAEIRDMAQAVLSGRTLTAVCRDLQERGVLTTRGNQWQAVSVRNLLTNPRLAGHSVLNGDIVGVGQWASILDAETWETVRALIENRRRAERKPRVSLLLGLLYCGNPDCGARMVTGGRGSKAGTLRTYRCQAIPGRQEGCGSVSGAAEPIEAIVEAYAQTRLADPRVKANIKRLQSSAGAGELALEIGTLEVRIQELEAQLDVPGIPVQTILRSIDRAKERLEDCQARLAAAIPTELPTRGGEWPKDLDRRRRLVALVVERVYLDPATKAGVFDPERVRIDPR